MRVTVQKISVKHYCHMTIIRDHNSWYLEVMIWLMFFFFLEAQQKHEARSSAEKHIC